MVQNTVTASFKNDLEKLVLEAVNSHSDSVYWQIEIVEFECLRGFQVIVTEPRGLVEVWYFESFDSVKVPDAITRVLGERS